MKSKNEILTVIEQQKYKIALAENSQKRNILSEFPSQTQTHAYIISGIRRCGKSTLMFQQINSIKSPFLYINFDTPLLYNFVLSDFRGIDDIISEQNPTHLFFDEVQSVPGWELYVRQKLDEGFFVHVTGSNASLLSRELGTKLTGRHITKELFPFSFNEFCNYLRLEPNAESVNLHLQKGGFPEYLKTNNKDVLINLFEDILYRDIAVRYGIRDLKSLKNLLLYLLANIGNLVSANKLTQLLGIKSNTTTLEYLNYFEESYLIQLLPIFSYSYKKQIVNPKKLYCIDTALADALSLSFSDNLGHKLENLTFNELRKSNKNIYYFNENNAECDFVVCNSQTPTSLIQVCYDLNYDNQQREFEGLKSAMKFFNMERGIIITLNQSDFIYFDECKIEVIPFWKWANRNL